MLAPSGLTATAGCERGVSAARAQAEFVDDPDACVRDDEARPALALLEIAESPLSLSCKFEIARVSDRVSWIADQGIAYPESREPGEKLREQLERKSL